MMKFPVLLACAAIISGCATQASIDTYKACYNESFSEYPVRNVEQKYTTKEYYRQQEGMTCTVNPSYMAFPGQLNCKPKWVRYSRNVEKTRIVDSNQTARESAASRCRAESCMRRFGNPDCEK